MNGFVYHKLQEEMELLAIVEKEQEERRKKRKKVLTL